MSPYIGLSRLQLRDRLGHSLLQQVLHGTDPDQGELLLYRLRRLGQPRLAARERRGRVVELDQPRLGLHLVERALGKHESAKPLRGEVVHVPRALVDELTLLGGDLAWAHRVAGWVRRVA